MGSTATHGATGREAERRPAEVEAASGGTAGTRAPGTAAPDAAAGATGAPGTAAPGTTSFTCVSCPMGCVLDVSLAPDGEVAGVSGNSCNRGIEYARQEAVDPRRNISAVVWAQGCLEPVSVKTAEPIPKGAIFEVMEQVRALDLHTPVQAGQVLLENAAGTGVAIVATKSLSS